MLSSSTVSLVSSTASSAESESFAYNNELHDDQAAPPLEQVAEMFDGGTYKSFIPEEEGTTGIAT